jgi:molybdate-binding protein/DNA-binding transcriptional regulator YhcF (GntR family)
MEEAHLYQQIAESIRHEILEGRLKPGERLPSVRALCETWQCTPGTAQRAYNELSRQGLLISHAGKGTRVSGGIAPAQAQAATALRRASLVHRSEAFLLESLTAGYELEEIQQALELAMDRWRTVDVQGEPAGVEVVRFSGSHGLAVNALAASFSKVSGGAALKVTYTGSLGGLMALAEGKADLCGCHLWDAEQDSYNLPFVRKILAERPARVVTLAHRRIGLILPPGNPLELHTVADLARPGLRFVNRQAGSGTRVWLDAQLRCQGLEGRLIHGYTDERMTHSEVARAVAEGQVDVGLGLETAAFAFGLDFVFLARERYDLVMLEESAQRPPLYQLLAWLASLEAKQFIDRFKGYENLETGRIQS